jgi:acyl carrier protein
MDDVAGVTDRVVEVLTQRLGIPAEAITPSAELVEELGVDSVDAVEFALALEREFKVSLPDGILTDVKTVQDVIELVRQQTHPDAG